MNDRIFSIVVPTFHRPLALTALLEAIRDNGFLSTQFEVIVIDDARDGDLDEVLAPFRECFSLVALRTPHLGPAPARQAGVDIASGAYLAFTDDDCIPDPNWLAEIHSALLKNPGCSVAGSLFNLTRLRPALCSASGGQNSPRSSAESAQLLESTFPLWLRSRSIPSHLAVPASDSTQGWSRLASAIPNLIPGRKGSLVLLSQLATGCGFVSERLRIS